MANGQAFDPARLTCASRHWPLGARLRVCNLSNGRCTFVIVTDRGPYAHGRVIDLSLAAAKKLGFVHRGLTRVSVTETDHDEEEAW